MVTLYSLFLSMIAVDIEWDRSEKQSCEVIHSRFAYTVSHHGLGKESNVHTSLRFIAFDAWSRAEMSSCTLRNIRLT